MLSRALIGGFFIHPAPPTSLEAFMKERKGQLTVLLCGGGPVRVCWSCVISYCQRAFGLWASPAISLVFLDK